MKTRHSGFTLTELFVVVLVIGIIAAFLFPLVAGKKKPNAHRSRCQSNLKQIGLALAQYRQDYDNLLPSLSNSNDGWVDLMEPYLKNDQVFQCPSANDEPKTSDYFFNARLAEEKTPKNAHLVIAGGDGPDNAPLNSHLSEFGIDAFKDAEWFGRRHLDGLNLLFGDGHVKWFPMIGERFNSERDTKWTFRPEFSPQVNQSRAE